MAIQSPFPALVVSQDASGLQARVTDVAADQLPPGEVTIRVLFSAINYKDALAVCRGAPILRSFPMVPGVDLAGVVEESADPRFRAGDVVMVNSWGVGESHWGGYARYARVPGDFVQRIPAGLDPELAMAIGTAGYTAMLCLMALEKGGLKPGAGDVLVTGASGGVGGNAIILLAHHGYRVVASTGRVAETPYLQQLGAAEVIDRSTLAEPGKPLQKERWLAAIDSVGGPTLANVCASTRYRGWVAACGLAQSMEFPATVAPFILRNVTLFGIDSVRAPMADREIAWTRLTREADRAKIALTQRTIPLAQVPETAQALLAGKVRGRTVVRIAD